VIPSVRLGKTVRIPVRQLREWVEEQVVETAAMATVQIDARGSDGAREDVDRAPLERRRS
jgi:hypothetical protein